MPEGSTQHLLMHSPAQRKAIVASQIVPGRSREEEQ